MTINTQEHIIETLLQSRILDEGAQRLRQDAGRMFAGLSPPERVEVAKQSGFSYQTLELLAASSR